MSIVMLPPYAMLAGSMGAAMGAAPGYPYVNSEAATLVAAMSVAPNDTRKGVIDTLIGELKTAGLWTLLDLLFVPAAHDEQAGRLNWKSPGNFTLTAVNSPVFTTDRGFKPNGTTSRLTTTWDAATNGVNFTQDAAHLGCYSLDDGTSGDSSDWGAGVSGYTHVRARAGTNAVVRVTGGSQITFTADGVSAPFHIMGIRRISTTIRLWRDGVERTTGAATSAALNTNDWSLGNAAGGFADRTIPAAHNGAALDDTQAAALYDALYDYMVAVGADT